MAHLIYLQPGLWLSDSFSSLTRRHRWVNNTLREFDHWGNEKKKRRQFSQISCLPRRCFITAQQAVKQRLISCAPPSVNLWPLDTIMNADLWTKPSRENISKRVEGVDCNAVTHLMLFDIKLYTWTLTQNNHSACVYAQYLNNFHLVCKQELVAYTKMLLSPIYMYIKWNRYPDIHIHVYRDIFSVHADCS